MSENEAFLMGMATGIMLIPILKVLKKNVEFDESILI